jgi:hypothetical protein
MSMNNYFFLIIVLAAIFCTACKDGNKKGSWLKSVGICIFALKIKIAGNGTYGINRLPSLWRE